jgi:FAD/FMN-containing dehydrogenase
MLDKLSIDKFKASLRGELLVPADSGYQEARSIWNGMIDRRPALIVQGLGVSDVITCVNFAREQNLTLSIKGGGHNISGLAVCDAGLVLDMSRMRGVWVDQSKRTAHAQAGVVFWVT